MFFKIQLILTNSADCEDEGIEIKGLLVAQVKNLPSFYSRRHPRLTRHLLLFLLRLLVSRKTWSPWGLVSKLSQQYYNRIQGATLRRFPHWIPPRPTWHLHLCVRLRSEYLQPPQANFLGHAGRHHIMQTQPHRYCPP